MSCSHTVGMEQRDPLSFAPTDGQPAAQSSVRGVMSTDNPMTQGMEIGFKISALTVMLLLPSAVNKGAS